MESNTTALGTLATKTGILSVGPAMTRGGKCLSVRTGQAIHGLTAGDGPHDLYIMNTDLSLGEVEAYIELSGPLSPNLKVENEIASRGKYVRKVGMLTPVGDGTVAVLSVIDKSMAGLRFSESGEGAGWTWLLYNIGRAMTTGSSWSMTSAMFVEWNPSG